MRIFKEDIENCIEYFQWKKNGGFNQGILKNILNTIIVDFYGRGILKKILEAIVVDFYKKILECIFKENFTGYIRRFRGYLEVNNQFFKAYLRLS